MTTLYSSGILKLVKISLLLYLMFNGLHAFSQTIPWNQLKADSLIKELKDFDLRKKELSQQYPDKIDTIKAELLWQLSLIYYIKDFNKSQFYVSELKALSISLNYQKGIANAITGQAINLSHNLKYPEANELHQKALKIRLKINDQQGIRWSYFNLGANCQWQNNINDAAVNYSTCLKLAESANDSILITQCYMCLGNIYSNLKNYKEAIAYNTKAINSFKALGDSFMYGWTLLYQSEYYMLSENYADAENSINQASSVAQHTNFPNLLEGVFSSAANLYNRTGKYDLAITNLQNSILIADSTNQPLDLGWHYNDIAESLLKANSKQLASVKMNRKDATALARSYLLKSLNFGIKATDNSLKREVYKDLFELAESENNNKDALKYFKLYISKKDEIYSSENTNSINNLKIQYETDKKEQRIALLNKEKALRQVEIEKQKFSRNIFIGGFILILLLAVISFNRYLLKKRANNEIEKTLDNLKTTQEKIVESEKLASMGKITVGVANQIQEPINQISQLADVNNHLLKNIQCEFPEKEVEDKINQLKLNLQEIHSFGKKADVIVKNLLIKTRSIVNENK